MTKPLLEKDKLGHDGEAIAVEYLRRKNYVILHTNCFIGKRELDIVAKDGETVVFAEVKTRRSGQFGNPADRVDADKQATLWQLAETYLKTQKLHGVPMRIDVLSIVLSETGEPFVEHIVNAFHPSDRQTTKKRKKRI